MKLTLPSALVIGGFVALTAGVGMVFGAGWSLIVGGSVPLGLGLYVAWRRGA